MKNQTRKLVAILVVAAVVVLSGLGSHAPEQTKNASALKRVKTDGTKMFPVPHSIAGAWFVEAVQ